MSATIRLGLIGDNIAASSAPRLHRLAGEMLGLDVDYELLVPREQGLDFEALFERCWAEGYRGLNVTYPYKARAFEMVRVDDDVGRIAAVNTVVFEPGDAVGYNTDHTGFIAGYRASFGARAPGTVALIGAGGVGKAVAFGLVRLGASEIRVHDRDLAVATGLVRALQTAGARAIVSEELDAALADAGGVINCTPIGMVGYPGSPVPPSALAGVEWVFEAVYTPIETLFLRTAVQAGARSMSGYELFFHQGLHASERFLGRSPDPVGLREALA